jgi:hypothetical protein
MHAHVYTHTHTPVMTFCVMTVKKMGMLGVTKMKALTVKMETVTLVGKGRQKVTCCVY